MLVPDDTKHRFVRSMASQDESGLSNFQLKMVQ